jgi:hypothetical protein
MNRLQYRRFLIGPKIGVLGQKIFPHHYLDNSHVNEMLRETLEQNSTINEAQTRKGTSRSSENSPSFTHRNRQTEKLITKLLSTNLNEIHKNYFKYLSINEKNKKSQQQTELEDNFSPNLLNAESSNSIGSNMEGEGANKTPADSNNFFMKRPISKGGSRTENRTKDTSDQTNIIYQLSKIHSNNKRRNYFNSSINHPSNSNKKSNNEYHEIEMKTLALVDFKEEKF